MSTPSARRFGDCVRRPYGCGQRMLARLLDRAGKPQDVGFLKWRQGDDRRQRGPALGQRARLVDDEHVDRFEPFERFRMSDQHAGAGAPAGANHDRHRRGEAERARTRDDQYGHGAEQAVRQPRLRSPQAPGNKGKPAVSRTAGTK